jgi:hypothetical protein
MKKTRVIFSFGGLKFYIYLEDLLELVKAGKNLQDHLKFYQVRSDQSLQPVNAAE